MRVWTLMRKILTNQIHLFMEYGKKERMGGFDLLKVKKGDMSFIVVRTIAGGWSIEYREDTVMYHCLDEPMDEPTKEALNVVIMNAYMSSTIVDAEFQRDIMSSAEKLSYRMLSEAEEISDEEDAKILEDERRLHEIAEEMEKEEDNG